MATNVTNLDVHDIARASRTFGVERYFVIHPMHDQRAFVHRMLDHWRVGEGAKYNPMRRTALTMVDTAESLEAAIAEWDRQIVAAGGVVLGRPIIVSTHARPLDGVPAVSFQALRRRIQNEPETRLFLIFGTGFGLTEEFMRGCDLLLEPIKGAPPDDYRHLSVRSAVSIILDRLLGAW